LCDPRGVDAIDFSYDLAVNLAGALVRPIRTALPLAWQLRLGAELSPEPEGAWVWLHAVSVGELLLAEGLLARLRDRKCRVHVTTGTPAGLGLLGRRLEAWDQASGLITGGAFPLDDAEGLAPFLRRPPSVYVALETELWPNLFRELGRRGVPICLVNGRLTPRSTAAGGPWMRRAASRLSLVAARDPDSAEAFRRLGAPRVALGGNLKADTPPPPPLHGGWQFLRAGWAGDPILVAGNTLEGEEALILAAWRGLREAFPALRLILAPRQPRRFQGVAEWLEGQGMPFRRASSPWPEGVEAWRETPVLLLDTLGELATAYGEGSVALVGGGWSGEGGHNPLEPVRWGLPTLLGPGFRNFEDLVAPLRGASRVEIVAQDLVQVRTGEILAGMGDSRPGMGGSDQLPAELRGALGNSFNLIQVFLPICP
jgi:3-deoxy-D-manno-octulosonic-acid transferase